MHIVRTFKLRLKLRTTIGCNLSLEFYYRRGYLVLSRLEFLKRVVFGVLGTLPLL